jgi:hypothetical protein
MGVSGQHHAPAPVPIVQEAGWAPEPVWTQRLEEKSFSSPRDRTPIARSSSPQSDTILPELPGSLCLLVQCVMTSLSPVSSATWVLRRVNVIDVFDVLKHSLRFVLTLKTRRQVDHVTSCVMGV